jgi:hypothetical protein
MWKHVGTHQLARLVESRDKWAEVRIGRWGLLLQTELAVGRLATPLAMLTVALALKFKGCRGAEFVDIAARETRAIGAIPVLFEEH